MTIVMVVERPGPVSGTAAVIILPSDHWNSPTTWACEWDRRSDPLEKMFPRAPFVRPFTLDRCSDHIA